jgi:hypothetical protein
MGEFITLIIAFFKSVILILDRPIFDVFSIDISLFDILISGLILTIVIGSFWKGAKG